jgi:hypothetical protein
MEANIVLINQVNNAVYQDYSTTYLQYNSFKSEYKVFFIRDRFISLKGTGGAEIFTSGIDFWQPEGGEKNTDTLFIFLPLWQNRQGKVPENLITSKARISVCPQRKGRILNYQNIAHFAA